MVTDDSLLLEFNHGDVSEIHKEGGNFNTQREPDEDEIKSLIIYLNKSIAAQNYEILGDLYSNKPKEVG